MSPSSKPAAGDAPADGGAPVGAGGAADAVERSVRLPVDLHARPAAKLTRTASGFAAEATVLAGERTANARSVLSVMALGATAGTAVTVRAVGADAVDAVAALVAVLAAGED